MADLPWNERVTAICINPEMARISDIMRLAEELMEAEKRIAVLEAEIAELKRDAEGRGVSDG